MFLKGKWAFWPKRQHGSCCSQQELVADIREGRILGRRTQRTSRASRLDGRSSVLTSRSPRNQDQLSGVMSEANAHLYIPSECVRQRLRLCTPAGLSRPCTTTMGVPAPRPRPTLRGLDAARAFPPWTWTQKGLAPPRPPASGQPRPDTHGKRVPAGSGRAFRRSITTLRRCALWPTITSTPK